MEHLHIKIITMVKKIISGGQTGADRAALDFAIKFDIPHGGWIAKGRKTEDGPLPVFYRLQEIPEPSYARRTEMNVLDADGTLIISKGNLTGGSEYTRKMAVHHGRPWLHIDLDTTSSFNAGEKIRNWIEGKKIEVLNVAGPRDSKEPSIYQSVFDILETAFYLDVINAGMHHAPVNNSREGQETFGSPKTVNEAAEEIISGLSFPERTRIANIAAENLDKLNQWIDPIIRTFFPGSENNELLDSCRVHAGNKKIDADDAGKIIARKVWEKLRTKKHVLRIIK